MYEIPWFLSGERKTFEGMPDDAPEELVLPEELLPDVLPELPELPEL